MAQQRDEKGRFIKGHGVKSPGRPPAEKEAHYLDILKSELTPDRWGAIIRRAIVDAVQGDGRAREWLGNYAMGRAPHIINLSAHDAALLSDLLNLLPDETPASELFEAMIAELSYEGDEDEEEV